MDNTVCPACGEQNRCAVANQDKASCWCMQLIEDENQPPLPIDSNATSCYCRPCLEKLKGLQIQTAKGNS